LAPDRELAASEGVRTRRHVAVPLSVDRQLLVADDDLIRRLLREAGFSEYREHLFVELDEEFVRSCCHERHLVEIVARTAEFAL